MVVAPEVEGTDRGHEADASLDSTTTAGPSGATTAPNHPSLPANEVIALLGIDTLSSGRRAVDEYGFFLPIPPNEPALKGPAFAPPPPSPSGSAPSSPVELEHRRRLTKKREREWIELMQNWKVNRSRRQDRALPPPTIPRPCTCRDMEQIKVLCRYGIPDSLRAQAWTLLSGAASERREGLYASLLSRPELPIFEQIEKDIHRCFPNHSLFAPGAIGQAALRNVLRAFAVYNQEVGYCQGMGMVAGVLLMRMPEEDTFWLFVAIVERYLEHLYSPGLEQLIIDAKVFEKLLPSVSRKVSRHLKMHGVDPLLFITPWFMTLFSTTLPWPTLLRLWDMFLCEGIKPVFRMALAIMKSCKHHLLHSCHTLSDILEFLLHIPHTFLQGEELVSISLSLSLSRSQLDRWIDVYRKELRKS